MAEGDVLGRNAGVADLVDASGSGPDGSNPWEVRLFSPARNAPVMEMVDVSDLKSDVPEGGVLGSIPARSTKPL
jgi:hypothetical protein